MTPYPIPVGTSEPQDFALVDAGDPIDGTGLTVTLEIKQKVGQATAVVDTPPAVTWLDRRLGTVRVTGVGVLTVGTYLVRYKLTDGSSNVGFTPNGEKADVWHVVPVANW